MAHESFKYLAHRPWPVPGRLWVLEQNWNDLLFLHWEIDPLEIRSRIPSELEIDTFGGKAWLAVVPFVMDAVGPRGIPKPSAVSDFAEINVRTYVVRDGKPGVYFFSLDVPNRLPVWLARRFFHLPYFKADMAVGLGGDGMVDYRSVCGERRFACRYRGIEEVEVKPGSFEEWSTERYCLYSYNEKRAALFRGEIHHRKWPLQKAAVEIEENSMLHDFNVGPAHPSVLFSKRIEVVAWMIERV